MAGRHPFGRLLLNAGKKRRFCDGDLNVTSNSFLCDLYLSQNAQIDNQYAETLHHYQLWRESAGSAHIYYLFRVEGCHIIHHHCLSNIHMETFPLFWSFLKSGLELVLLADQCRGTKSAILLCTMQAWSPR
jgi:hypothetical protein